MEKVNMPISTNEIGVNSKGGTELMCEGLKKYVDPELLDKVNIIPSRFRGCLVGMPNIYWAHDLPGDPESDCIKSGNWNMFEKLVFVSNWQMQNFQKYYGFPWYKGEVMLNAIDPIENVHLKTPLSETNQIRLIYHTTPHRGLQILVPVFEKLAEKYKHIHLDVFSSFKIYGWAQRDEQYEALFERCRNHPQITYHGFADQETVRAALARSHIFVYPSIWLETSCRALMEAMSAELICIHPNYGALYETAANWTMMYQWHENQRDHAAVLYNVVEQAIINEQSDAVRNLLKGQKLYADSFYSWSTRGAQWNSLLSSIIKGHHR
jgi:glycosyltransferase involved in cell wall biosynthesis